MPGKIEQKMKRRLEDDHTRDRRFYSLLCQKCALPANTDEFIESSIRSDTSKKGKRLLWRFRAPLSMHDHNEPNLAMDNAITMLTCVKLASSKEGEELGNFCNQMSSARSGHVR